MSPQIRVSSPLQVRLPTALRENIKLAASTNGRSMNAELVHALENQFAKSPETVTNADSIFPQTVAHGDHSLTHGGLRLRDYFAAQALIGMMRAMVPYSGDFERSARDAYKQADAMLQVREAQP